MLTRRFLTVPLALTLAAMSSNAASDIPRIGKPRPAPATTPDILPLPPAVIDNNLQIGGDNVKAREVDTRLSVDVRVNGRGPYHFVVDSGADTSVVGTRMAQALQLPMGTPVILNGMTGRNIVDRVKVAALTLGPTTVSDLEVPALREIDLGADGLVGIDALVNQRLMMDFEKHVIKVEDASIPMRHLPGEIVITAQAPARAADPDPGPRLPVQARRRHRYRVGNHHRQYGASRQAAAQGPHPVLGRRSDRRHRVKGHASPGPDR